MVRSVCRRGNGVASRRFAKAAIEYRERFGWSCIAVIGKKPAGSWRKYQSERPTDADIEKMFGRAGVTGVAVIGGAVSDDLVIRDFDRADAYEKWAGDHANLAETFPTVRTRRGFHVYARWPACQPRHFADGELRGEGHYCLAPPSRHPHGTNYRWVIEPVDCIPLIDPHQAGLAVGNGINESEEASQGSARHGPFSQASQAHQLHVVRTIVKGAINRTLPTRTGERNRKLFALARELRGILPADVDVNELLVIVRIWHAAALPVISTKDFETTWVEFLVAWGRVKRPAGQCWWTAIAAAEANAMPVVAGLDDPHGQRLAALCVQLQSRHGAKPFPLPQKKVAEYLGVSSTRAWELIQVLLVVGVLEPVSPADRRAHRAAEYRLVLECPPF